jgi:benzylsuccinate CoA-transferase BbsE subunit
MKKEQAVSMLSPYRVLDLTDEKGFLCGKLFGDLGADVIKVEKPRGDPSRNISPFYHDKPDPEKSLFWWAYNTNKRGITLNIESQEGKDIFKRLTKTTDFVIESFPAQYMSNVGLGYNDLEKVNPGLIMASITPFGQTGPYKEYKCSDIVGWAMGGYMYAYGDPDRPPVRISCVPQAYLHAGLAAAVGAMMALFYRHSTGKGQQVDVSIQESVAHALDNVSYFWDLTRTITHRKGSDYHGGSPIIWPCKDGYISWIYWMGLSIDWNQPLIKMMESEGMANDFLKNFDWSTFDYHTAPPEIIDAIMKPTNDFFMSHTKAELHKLALKFNAMLQPVANASDLLESTQLASREFWIELVHPELDTKVIYPGTFGRFSEGSQQIARRAPLIGEHNQEIYEKELGLSRNKIIKMKQAGII